MFIYRSKLTIIHNDLCRHEVVLVSDRPTNNSTLHHNSVNHPLNSQMACIRERHVKHMPLNFATNTLSSQNSLCHMRNTHSRQLWL